MTLEDLAWALLEDNFQPVLGCFLFGAGDSFYGNSFNPGPAIRDTRDPLIYLRRLERKPSRDQDTGRLQEIEGNTFIDGDVE